MSEEEINEAMQYNLDYTEAMLSDELFGTNEVAEVKLLASEKAIKDLQQKVEEKNKEIDRLNNIINELEKDIKTQLSQGGPREIRDLVDGYDILDKLKELKENK